MAFKNGYNNHRTMKVKVKNADFISGSMKLNYKDTMRALKHNYQYVRVNGEVFSISINSIFSGKEDKRSRKQILQDMKNKVIFPALWLDPVS